MAMTTPTNRGRPHQPATVGSGIQPGQREETAMSERASSAAQADTRVLAAVHRAFRLATVRLVDATDKLSPAALQPIIGSRWGFYTAVLDHHHHIEDDMLFPSLLAVRPDMGTVIDKLMEDHRQLDVSMDAAGAAVSAFQAQAGTASQKAVHDAIVAVRDTFFPHLDVEDARLLPAFAQSIPPKQWDRIDKKALKSIPRSHLPTAVGALDEVIRSLPNDQRPSPPPPPIRLLLALSWRKKWAEWAKPLQVS
jgi:hemerythrin-like domain-containing protein